MPLYKALLIGNSRFALDATLQPLQGPVYDVRALRGALTDPEVGLFAAADVRVLLERGAQEILVEIQRFLDSATRDDVLLLYYSGHGVLDNHNQLFLRAADTRTDVLRATSVGSTAINSMIADSAARTTVIMLDCCHSGAFKGGDLPAALAGSGRFVLASCRGGELAADTDARNGTSLFTTYLVEALSTGGVGPNGYLSLDELYQEMLRQLDELRPRRPLPQRHFSGVGDVAIARRPRARPVQPPQVETPTTTPAAAKAATANPGLVPGRAAARPVSDRRGRRWRIPAAVGAAAVLATTVIVLYILGPNPGPINEDSGCVPGGSIPLRSGTGEPCSGEIANPSQMDVYRLTAVSEQTLYFDVAEGCADQTLQWRLNRVGVRDTLFNTALGGYDDQCQDPGLMRLEKGEYELSVSTKTGTGGYRFTVYDATPQRFTLTIGDTVELNRPESGAGRIESPGTTDIYRLTAADQKTLYFDVIEGCAGRTLQWRLNRAGVQDTLFNTELGGYDDQCQDPGPMTLEKGEYELSVSGIDAGVGGYRFTVHDATPQRFTLTVGDTVELDRPESGAGRIESPGTTDIYRLTVVDQKTLLFDVTAGCIGRALQWLLTRVGVQEPLFDRVLGGYDDQCQDPEPLTLEAGEYELSVSGTDANVGGYRFQVRSAE